jgi:glycosyltransferase involved in cell wall biosynthesis
MTGLLRKAWHLLREQGLRGVIHKLRRKWALLFNRGPYISLGQDLRVRLDHLPQDWVIGKGNVCHLTGWCYHPRSDIAHLAIVVDGIAFPVNVGKLSRPEALAFAGPEHDPDDRRVRSGFYALVPVSGHPDRKSVHLTIEARLRNGVTVSRGLGDIRTTTPEPSRREVAQFAERCGRPAIAICMTTFNPPLELFRRQIHSVQAQTCTNWICIISDDGSSPAVFKEIVDCVADDPRFFVRQNGSRVGFYHNFENCLALVPESIDYVALADHDDFWHDDKLASLLAAFDADTTLVYSDMNIVDPSGHRLAGSYWTTRSNNSDNLGSMFLANTITGAASMFRRSLLDYLLPFPDKIGTPFHDHWIGCTALTLGKIKYIDRPLYDYVQHGGNVIGHFIPPRELGFKTIRRVARGVLPCGLWKRLQDARPHWQSSYMNEVLRIQQLATIVQLRCGRETTPSKRRILHRLAHLDSSLISIAWLLFRSLASLRRKTVTMGAENCLLRGIAWKRGVGLLSWLRAVGKTIKEHWMKTIPGTGGFSSGQARQVLLEAIDRVDALERKIAPLAIRCSADVRHRVNLLIPTIDFDYVFGGYITKFNLALRLARAGHRVRLITVDPCHYQPARWQQQLRAYPGLENLLDCVEIACALPRSKALEFNPQDGLIATTWWTAHIAHAAARQLGQQRFVYLIQEFEPFTFPMGTYAALAEESYSFPHHAVFSSEFLRDYFRDQRLGVFAHNAAAISTLALANTITAVGPITAANLRARSRRRLLYYARPEPHAARNMFELGIAALRRAIKAGYFGPDWEFTGIGTIATAGKIPLAPGISLSLMPRQGQENYREVLRAHDLGLSLMYTPHPSLVPIEMASAGMLTVTNTCGNKTSELLCQVSSNLIAVEPTIQSVQQGLKHAADHIQDYEERAQGARVRWTTDWDQAFHPEFMARLGSFLDGTATGQASSPRAA